MLLNAQSVLPVPDAPFNGKIDANVRSSIASWPSGVKAPTEAPNIVLILVDDIGFGETSTFGGPANTPNYTRLATDGLRYNEFQVNPICSPTRASLLSGRNAHEMGFGNTTDLGAGYPGYDTIWPRDSTSIAEVLKDNGYSTAAFGKWHNTPVWEVGPAGPFDHWPTGLGFEYFYGFMTGSDNQYYPRIYENTIPVEPSHTPRQGYHFTTDITDHAIRWLHEHDAAAHDRPFFLYFAPGAVHAPHQVPAKWIAQYQGRFDEGWDKLREEIFERQKKLGVIPANTKLTPRPSTLPAWSSLDADTRRLLAHQAEVYAAYVTQTDEEIGRLLQAINEEGETKNTLVLWIFGDNGGSAQGSLVGFDSRSASGVSKSIADRLVTEQDIGSDVFMNEYAAAWAWAESCPFQGAKVDAAHLGGTRDPLIIAWPARIKDAGGLRSQFSHVTDIAPTLYEAAGITPPKIVSGVKQTPLEGTSLLYTFDNPSAPGRHRLQYFEARGNRAIYKDGWWAGDVVRETWEPNGDVGESADTRVNLHPWELYDLNTDYSQADNLAAKYPEKLKELQQDFDREAKRNNVYPLLPPSGSLPLPQRSQKTFVYRTGVERLPSRLAPPLAGHGYTITADLDVPPSGASGVIFALGGRYGGETLFVSNDRVFFEINAFGNRSGQIISSNPLAPGKNEIVVEIDPGFATAPRLPGVYTIQKERSATGKLTINGRLVGQGRFANINVRADESLDIGCDLGSPVSLAYRSPNSFTGEIRTVTIQLR